MDGHTQFPLSNLLRHDAKDRENLNHDLYDNVCHSCGRPNVYVLLKTPKKVFHAAKQVDKSVFASANILNGLRHVFVKKAHIPRQEAYLEEDTNASKNRTRRWKYLPYRCHTRQRVDLAQLSL